MRVRQQEVLGDSPFIDGILSTGIIASTMRQREGCAQRVLSWRTSWPRSTCLTKQRPRWLALPPSRLTAFQPCAPITPDWLPPGLGAEGAMRGITKSFGLLKSPSDTTSGAHAAWVDILGADREPRQFSNVPLCCGHLLKLSMVRTSH